MASNNSTLDESILSLDGENMPVSFALLSMGINVKKQNYGTRLKGALDNFNACYLDAMDFLTQILPVAKQHFGKHDAILLPKTPSKKRNRQRFVQKEKLNDIMENNSLPFEDKENVQANVVNESKLESLEQPLKRITRSSKARPCTKEVEPTKQKRSQKKKSSRSDQSTTHNIIDVTQPQVRFNVEEKELRKAVPIDNEQPEQHMILKRSSSSPTSKQSTKRSKFSEDLPVDINITVEDQTRVPDDNKHAGHQEGLSQTSKEPMKKSRESCDRDSEFTVLEENASNDVLEKRPLQDEGNELERTEIKKVKKDKSVEPSRVETNSHISDKQNSCHTHPVACINKQKGSDENELEEINMKEKKYGLHQISSPPSPGIADKSVDENIKSQNFNGVVSTEAESLDKSHNELVQEGRSNISASSPNKGKDLPNNKTDDILNKDKPEETATPREETSTKKTMSEKPGSVKSNMEATTNSQPWVRRSTRSVRRFSRVSIIAQNKCRSSRKSSHRASCRSSCLKKPLVVKKVEKNPSHGESSSTDSGLDCQFSEKVKPSSALSDQSSAESEEEPNVKSFDPIASTPDIKKGNESLWSTTKMSLKVDRINDSKDLSNEDAIEPLQGKVAGIVQEMNRNAKTLEEPGNVRATPNGIRKVKRLGSVIKRSSSKPSNIVGGNIRSFIKRPSTKKPDANELVRLKKLELQRKEEKEKERKDLAELRRKNWVEEQKRKREEKQKKVAEAKAARDKEEKEKKQRQVEEKKQLLQVLEQAKKKREQEEENKRKLREQRKKEADARRLKENEERLKRLHEKEEEDRMYREMLKRKQEHEEQERKQRIQEEKRLQEQKHRERQREQEEERQRKLREIKEREQKRVEKENEGEGRAFAEKKNKEDLERKEKEEKEKKLKVHEDAEQKRLAQLIKEKLEQNKKLWEEKHEKEKKERMEREEQKGQRGTYKLNQFPAASTSNKQLAHVKSIDSYQMTPPPCQTRKPSTDDNYDINDIRSDESTDDEDCPRKKVPAWAQGAALKAALLNQTEPRRIFEFENGPYVVHPPDLDQIFQKKRKRFYYRTSSAHWDSPPIKKGFPV